MKATHLFQMAFSSQFYLIFLSTQKIVYHILLKSKFDTLSRTDQIQTKILPYDVKNQSPSQMKSVNVRFYKGGQDFDIILKLLQKEPLYSKYHYYKLRSVLDADDSYTTLAFVMEGTEETGLVGVFSFKAKQDIKPQSQRSNGDMKYYFTMKINLFYIRQDFLKTGLVKGLLENSIEYMKSICRFNSDVKKYKDQQKATLLKDWYNETVKKSLQEIMIVILCRFKTGGRTPEITKTIEEFKFQRFQRLYRYYPDDDGDDYLDEDQDSEQFDCKPNEAFEYRNFFKYSFNDLYQIYNQRLDRWLKKEKKKFHTQQNDNPN